jgi:cytochrome c oxidase assembly factor CtaG
VTNPDTARSFADLVSRWDPGDPFSILVLFFAAVYAFGLIRLAARAHVSPLDSKRVYAGFGGFAALYIALAGPFDAFAAEAFWVHMTQHIIISMVAAPLLLVAGPMPAYLWAMPETARQGAGEILRSQGPVMRSLRWVIDPRITVPLFMGTLFAWHAPALFSATLNNVWVHYFQHFTFFLTAALFWWPIIGPAPVRSKLSYPQRLLYLLSVVTPTAVLAAILTMSRGIIYDDYIGTPMHWNMTTLEDQTMGGLILWIPGNALYLAALTVIFFTWASKESNDAVTAQPTSSTAPRKRRGPRPTRGGTLQRSPKKDEL